ncbi:tyrosine-type recombinase/integrase [Ruegeria arenilitoris]|uniref:tyrosine-type recombinase/integrase n=1 Tax=Ruegeria arenilitoris TaxID=1173585 RepID=UPI001480F71F|nr:site-specific integrase [Ruegeria arenilitoris]
MTDRKLSANERALKLLNEALATGVRNERRKAIQQAIDVFEGRQGKPSSIRNITLDNMKPGDRFTDPEHMGLVFRCNSDGVQAYYRWRHPVSDKQTETHIGRYPDLALGDIRDLHSDLLRQRKSGNIPKVPKVTVQAVMSVKEMVDRYLEEYAKPFKRSWRDDERLLNQYLVEPFGDYPANEITKDIVSGILDTLESALRSEGKSMRTSQLLRAVMSKMYNYAMAVPLNKEPLSGQPINRVSWLPAGSTNPVAMTQKAGYKAQRHSPKIAELRTFYEVAATRSDEDSSSDAMARKVLQLQALTFTRINEACAVEWSEIDFEAGTWEIPASKSKNRHAHKVMLSRQAMELLQSLDPDTAKSPFVFPAATDPQRHIIKGLVQKFWRTQRQADSSINPKFGTHGVRRAGAAFVKRAGGNEDVRDRLLNHVDTSSVDRMYSEGETLDGAALRYSQQWADHLDSLISSNIVQIHEARSDAT